MKKILVPTDFTEPSQWALEVATDIATRSGAQVIVLHVIEEPTKQSFNVGGEWEMSQSWDDKLFILHMIRKSKNDLWKIATDLEAEGLNIKTILRIGNAYHGISSIIANQDVDLVVMGTYGHTRLEKMLLGSNTEKVIRHARCPVLTVHEKPTVHFFRNIVYATSINQEEKKFANVLKVAQELYDSTVHVVRINTRLNFSSDRHIRKSMEDFVTSLQLRNYTLNIFNDHNEEDGILHFAEMVNADLIGMATHGRSGFSHVITGSISEEVSDHSKRPVLTFLTQ